MTRFLTAAGAVAAVFALSIAAPLSADAAPLVKAPAAAAPQGMVDQVARRGGGGGGGPRMHGGGGGGHRFHGGPRPGGPRFGGGGRGPGRPHYHGPRPGGGGHHHRGPRFRSYYPYAFGFGAYPYYYFDDYGSDYAECEPLRRRAVATRSRYWWNRYYACIED